MRFVFLFIAAFCVAACADDYESRLSDFQDFVSENKIAPNGDFWLVDAVSYSGPLRVGLIFGYTSNQEICEEMAKSLTNPATRARYYCEAAN